MDDSTPISGATGTVEFYLPATFQFRPTPGRIERLLARAFGRRDRVDGPAVDSSGPAFYLPGTPDVRPVKGR